MKRFYTVMLVALMCMLLGASVTPRPASANAWMDDHHHNYLHWLWEGQHATMINALLITANDNIVKNHEKIVMLTKEYSERDPLIRVYGLREREDDDSDKDAFLVGLKANNLIYLIHVADDNPEARKLAIRELRLLGEHVHDTMVKREFPYWAELLEEGRYPSRRLSHIYVHHTIDVGNFFEDRQNINKRFLFWLGYLVNDFTIANLCQHEDWMTENQKYMEKLYSVRIFGHMPRSVYHDWDKINTADLSLKQAIDSTNRRMEGIKTKWTDRGMGK